MILFSPNRLHYCNFGALCALYCIYVLWACHIIEKKVNIVRFAWKLAEHSRIMILIPTLIFWISNPKSIFWKILSERVKAICFAWKLAHTHTHTHTHTQTHSHTPYLEDADSYSEISFLKFQTHVHFLDKFELKKLNSPLCLEAGTQSILRMWL